jgi:hypothetical protein
MQQTLLSLLALLLVTLLSFNQQQASIQSQQQIVRAEMEQMALGVAMQTMEVIRAREFDAKTEIYSESEILDDPSDKLTSEKDFGKKYQGKDEDDKEIEYDGSAECIIYPGNSSDLCSFVEEYDGRKTTVPFYLGENKDEEEEDFQFFVEITVEYVNDNFEPTGGDRTLQKKVNIFVRDNPSVGSPRLPEQIRYSEVFSYP